MTDALPTTTTDRLLAVAAEIEAEPERWRQSDWGAANVSDLVGQGTATECGTTACVAGWAVRFTPAGVLDDTLTWEEAGAVALGLAPDLARMLFAGGFQPSCGMPPLLRAIAELPEGRRTARVFLGKVLAGAYLAGARLARADLAGADLARADLARAYLVGARGNEHTRLPAGWKVNDAGLIVKEEA